ncbi:hypothetical protein ACFVAR_23375 [Bacillus subtilis]
MASSAHGIGRSDFSSPDQTFASIRLDREWHGAMPYGPSDTTI